MSLTQILRVWDAIECENFSNAHHLIKKCWDLVATPVRDGISVMHLLSGLDDPKAQGLLRECLEHGASPNAQSSDGITPVHLAAMWGLSNTLKMLISFGGDPELLDKESNNAMHYAYLSTEPQAGDCVKFLSSMRASVEEKSTVNYGPVVIDAAYVGASGTPVSSLDSMNSTYSCKEPKFTHIKQKQKVSNDLLGSQNRSKHKPFMTDDETTNDETLNLHDFITDDESTINKTCGVMTEVSIESDMSTKSESFHTAFEGETFSLSYMENLDDSDVSFPKLHPWSSRAGPEELEDTLVDNISALNLEVTGSPDIGTNPCHSTTLLDHTLSDGTVLYDWKDFSILELSSNHPDETLNVPEELLALSCQELRKQLMSMGLDVGPVRPDTRALYIKQLARLKTGITSEKSFDRFSEFLPELRAILQQKVEVSDMYTEEESMCIEFTRDNPQPWREGTEKSSFNYLLLDPRVSDNLPWRAQKLPSDEAFAIFVSAIFYVGKGKRSRPYAHLHEALHKTKSNRKLQNIRDIWDSGLGVVSLHCFQSVIPVEAYTREACMVEALGLSRLTNQKKGDFYGRARRWSVKKKRNMGIFLLKRALQIFINEGERQIRPEDLRK